MKHAPRLLDALERLILIAMAARCLTATAVTPTAPHPARTCLIAKGVGKSTDDPTRQVAMADSRLDPTTIRRLCLRGT